jgi:hypothetical protein
MNFLNKFSKNTQDINFNEKSSSGGQVLPFQQTDRQTDTTKQTVAVCNFANTPKKQKDILLHSELQ